MVNLYGYDTGSSLVILGSGDVLNYGPSAYVAGEEGSGGYWKGGPLRRPERNCINCLEVMAYPKNEDNVTQIHGTARIEA